MIYKSILFLFITLIAGCSGSRLDNYTFRIAGSDTMLELTSNLAEVYMKEHPGISIKVEGGGTAEGIKSLIKGNTDICTASRNLKPEESKLLADYYHSVGLIYLIAKDGLSIYIQPSNPVKNLTMNQLKDIFTGKINNWKTLGGKDTAIIIVTRNPNSGTYLYFKEHVLLGENYTSNSIVEATTKAIVNYISEHSNAIGYGGMGFNKKVFHLKINGIESIEANVINDTYPITRYLNFITTNSPNQIVKEFINWVLSPAGQSVVRNSGYIPLWENKL